MPTLRFLLLAATLLIACSDDPAAVDEDGEPTHEEEGDDDGSNDSSGSLDGGSLDARRPDAKPAEEARPDATVAADAAAPPIVDAEVEPPVRIKPSITPPLVTGPLAGKPITTSTLGDLDLAEHGYIEQEFFIEGTANAYKAKGTLGIDGKWGAERDTQARYVSRLVVRRPLRAQAFNGTVVVEWLNVTGTIDTEIAFPFAWEELLRGGYAYVGVTVQKAGSDNLKPADAKYADLVHPGDTYAYDLYAQAGMAVGWPDGVKPLGELVPQRLIAYGESQSAMRMITYVNAIHPLTKVYDAYFIHSRAGWGAAVGDESDALLGDGKPVQVRADLGARVLQFFTESEIVLALGPAHAARQADTDWVRTWEVAGTAHADTRLLGKDTDLACGGATVNDGPQHYVVKAALRSLHRWLADGVAPAHGSELKLTTDKSAIARDAHGNAQGGIRTPKVDVPTATHSGVSANPACMLFGYSTPFTTGKLRTLYPTHQDYVSRVEVAAKEAREAGFLLPEEETTIVAEATSAAVP
ncbi:MAG: alpha/beta hydrolase domain-containing protein [Polyangiales bacterium]